MSQRFVYGFTMRGALRRPLTSKMGNKDYYKGKGSGPMGRHTKHGSYIIELKRIRNFIVPDLTGCQLRAYASHMTPKVDVPQLTVKAFLSPPLGPDAKADHPQNIIQPPQSYRAFTKDEKSPTYLALLDNIIRHKETFKRTGKLKRDG